MDYRKLPHGEEKLSTIGIGTSYTHMMSRDEIVEFCEYAFDHGINVIDYLSRRKGVAEAMAEAIRPRRKDIFLQSHCGVHYPNDQYTKNRDVEITKRCITDDLKLIDSDYLDVAFIGNVDEVSDLDEVMKKGGIWDYMLKLKEEGTARHLGFSSHNVSMCNRLLDMGAFDLFMLSESIVDDFGEETGRLEYKMNGNVALNSARYELFKRCEREGVGITTMKTFWGGKLLDKATSPFGTAFTQYQCIKYNLDRPAILSCLLGAQNLDELKYLLGYYEAGDSEKDYSIIGTLKMSDVNDSCIYCDHCQPCTADIEIAAVNRYKDLAEIGDTDALDHYKTLTHHASDCIECGLCDERCPFGVGPQNKMAEAAKYFGY